MHYTVNNKPQMELTPREKAIDIYYKHYKLLDCLGNYNIRKPYAKKAAILTVKEILEEYWKKPDHVRVFAEDYWIEVELEISKIE